MSSNMVLWEGTGLAKIPANENTPEQILAHANSRQLSVKDRNQIVYAFNNEHYEMVSSFVWNKAVSSLKAQLGKLGVGFIAEMLDRSDIPADASVAQVLTDHDALRLARELGIVSSTGYLRLRQSLDLLAHFGQLGPEDAEDCEFSQNDAVSIVRACVQTILGQERIDVAVDFKAFRDSLESTVFERSSQEIKNLEGSPYFFKRASIRILLALVKSRSGAQLENALGNANLIIPMVWSELFTPDLFQIGRAYSEIVADGKAQAASGMKKVLLKVKGFDYVPEDLRSRSFRVAAQRVIEAHEGMNNFYNEPGPMKALAEMGSTIPRAAFPSCMTAILSVRLGNPYGVCYDAQSHVSALLTKLSVERWLYYLDNCLRADERILEKLSLGKPFKRWVALVSEFDLQTIVRDAKDKDVKLLIQESRDPDKPQRALNLLARLEKKMGFVAEG